MFPITTWLGFLIWVNIFPCITINKKIVFIYIVIFNEISMESLARYGNLIFNISLFFFGNSQGGRAHNVNSADTWLNSSTSEKRNACIHEGKKYKHMQWRYQVKGQNLSKWVRVLPNHWNISVFSFLHLSLVD